MLKEFDQKGVIERKLFCSDGMSTLRGVSTSRWQESQFGVYAKDGADLKESYLHLEHHPNSYFTDV